jgi:Protein phosphatase 2C
MPADDSPLRWSVAFLPKQGYRQDEYEDAYACDAAAGRFAVADGASESAFAGLWARLLVEGFVAAPEALASWTWLEGPQRHWSGEVMGLELPWYIEMKRTEGAYATLLGLDVRPPTRERPGLWRAVAIGDSCLFRVRKGQYVRAFPVKQASAFDNAPRLLRSRTEPLPEATSTSGALLAGDRLLLMTDALAMWFLSAHERGGRPWEALAPLLSGEQHEGAFADWIEEQRAGDALRDDDVTLVIIDVGSAPEE